jgi:hypothetical protein
MKEFTQKSGLRQLDFELTDDGVFQKQKYFLHFSSNERFYPYYDLGIDVVKKSNNEGIPTLVIIGVMTILSSYVAITNLSKKLSLALVFISMTIFYAFVIIYTIQKYLSSTYELTGGNLSLSFLRYKSANAETLHLIDEIKTKVKTALIKKYNSLIQHLKPNDKFEFEQIPADQTLSDDEFRLLHSKADLLYRNIIFEGVDDFELEDEADLVD